MAKHQCDYCPWYYRGCECPYVMRASACEKAKNKKEREESHENRNKI